jgi:hypothetical protein
MLAASGLFRLRQQGKVLSFALVLPALLAKPEQCDALLTPVAARTLPSLGFVLAAKPPEQIQ